MVEVIWFLSVLILILLILIRIPQKDGTLQSFNMSGNLLGSPKSTDTTLQNITWGLTLIFLLLTGLKSYNFL
jgi:preprotein translocase subunit SecG